MWIIYWCGSKPTLISRYSFRIWISVSGSTITTITATTNNYSICTDCNWIYCFGTSSTTRTFGKSCSISTSATATCLITSATTAAATDDKIVNISTKCSEISYIKSICCSKNMCSINCWSNSIIINDATSC